MIARISPPTFRATGKDPRRATRILLQRSVGTASGFDRELADLARFLDYQLNRFLEQRRLYGRWTLTAFIAREEIK